MEFNDRHIEDIQLWQKTTQGDQTAIALLYKRHFQVLYSLGFRISGDKALCQDCVHDVFTYLWDHRENLHDVRHVRAYLSRSVKNRVLKQMAQQGKTVPLDNQEMLPIDLVFSTEAIMVQNQGDAALKARLQTALGSLTKRQKELVYLYFYEGMSTSEIQEATGLKYQSVKNLTFRALTTLRKALKNK